MGRVAQTGSARASTQMSGVRAMARLRSTAASAKRSQSGGATFTLSAREKPALTDAVCALGNTTTNSPGRWAQRETGTPAAAKTAGLSMTALWARGSVGGAGGAAAGAAGAAGAAAAAAGSEAAAAAEEEGAGPAAAWSGRASRKACSKAAALPAGTAYLGGEEQVAELSMLNRCHFRVALGTVGERR